MEWDYLEQFWVTHWTSQWVDSEPMVEDVFDHLDVFEGILRDVPPSSYEQPSLTHAQVDFLINHLEDDWRALAEGIRYQGNYASLYFYYQ